MNDEPIDDATLPAAVRARDTAVEEAKAAADAFKFDDDEADSLPPSLLHMTRTAVVAGCVSTKPVRSSRTSRNPLLRTTPVVASPGAGRFLLGAERCSKRWGRRRLCRTPSTSSSPCWSPRVVPA